MQGVQMHPNDTVRENKKMTKKIAFQGALGAYSHEACNAARPDLEPLACQTFDQVIAAVNFGPAEYTMPRGNDVRARGRYSPFATRKRSTLSMKLSRVRISMMANQGVSLSDVKLRAHLVHCRRRKIS